MKRNLMLCIAIAMLFSCRKDTINEKINGEPIVSAATIAERVYTFKNTGLYSDTCTIAKTGYGIVMNGNSIVERMLYANWKMNWISKGYPALNRGIGGTTWNEKIPYIKDLTTVYKPLDIILYDGENEFLRASASDTTVATKLLVAFNRTVDSMRKANPAARIYVVSMLTCPALAKKGSGPAINRVNEGYQAKVNRDAALYPGKIKFIDIRPLYPTADLTKFETDLVHIRITAYNAFYDALKQALPKPGTNAWGAPVVDTTTKPVDTIVPPPVTDTTTRTDTAIPPPPPPPTISTNQPPIANAGADVTISKSWNYNPYIYGTYSKDPDGWIAAFKWSCIQGTQYTIVTPTSGKTRLDNLAIGVYVFRVTVTDNKGAQATDDVKVTVTK